MGENGGSVSTLTDRSVTPGVPFPGGIDGFLGRSVLVTGGAGFIGSSLCRVLARSGAQVRVVDDLTTGSRANLPDDADTGPGTVELVVADVRDDVAVHQACVDAEIVFHLACLGVRHSLSEPGENFDVNATGSLCVLEAARRAGVSRIVHVSSSEVYGDAVCAPMTERHPTRPHTVYGAGKLAGETCALALWRTHGLDAVVIRPFNAYGPRSHAEGDSGEVIPRFLVQALEGDPLHVFGSGDQTRDFTHVYDTATTIARAGLASDVGGRTFNVGSGREVSIAEVARTIVAMTGSASPIVHAAPRPGDVARLIADSTEAARVLGHRPVVELADGLSDLARRLQALTPPAFAALAGAVDACNWR